MVYAITQSCCSDASCVAVCPVNCIHPTPEERDFGSTEMLHIDPRTCIDCGACADACPVDAIIPVDALTGERSVFADLNAEYYADRPAEPAPAGSPNFHSWGQPSFERSLPADFAPIRVAVVGSGPAGMYAAEDLLLHTNAEVSLVDRMTDPGGLVRYGVAPDHPETKQVGEAFGRVRRHPRMRTHLGVEIGRDLSHDELIAHHDAVVYAIGAPSSRDLGIPGEELPGSLAASRFVAWCNGHPEIPADEFDLGTERVVVVGTGNVALDAARLLLTPPSRLAEVGLPPHVHAALAGSRVREVVLLGRRGPEHAAWTRPELLALIGRPGLSTVVDGHDPAVAEAIRAAEPGSKAALLADLPVTEVDYGTTPGETRLVLRFGSAPVAAEGADAVRAVRVTDARGTETTVPAGLLLRSVGHRSVPVPGLPFDEERGVVANTGGRVDGLPGTYVVGWGKRGPSGGIGANRQCAGETVGALLEDAVAGRLPEPGHGERHFRRLLRQRRRGHRVRTIA